MPATATCRAEVEALLRARKLDRTLVAVTVTSGTTVVPETIQTGVPLLDQRLGGGIPMGQFSEIVGPRSSGRTSLLLSLLAGLTRRGELAALIDTFDIFDAESAAAAGVRLDHLLWVRGQACTPAFPQMAHRQTGADRAVERALKAANLVLHSGGFSLVALDLADAPVQALRRIPMTTWMRLQRVIEGQSCAGLVVGTAPLSRSAGGVTLLLQPSRDCHHEPCCKPLDAADTCISRVRSVAALGPQPSADFGPCDAFVEHSCPPRSHGLLHGSWWQSGSTTTIFRGLESDVQIQRARLLPGVANVPVRLRASAVA